MDYDLIGKNDFIGRFSFSLAEILDPANITSGWFILLDAEQGNKNNFISRPGDISGQVAVAAARPVSQTPATKLVKAGTGKKYSVEDFNFVKVLGRGSFGKVLLASDKKTNEVCQQL